MGRPAHKKRTLPTLPPVETPPAAQREAVYARRRTVDPEGVVKYVQGEMLREPIVEADEWPDPHDLNPRTRAPKMITAFRRVDQLARLKESGAISREQHDAAVRFQRDAEQAGGARPGRDLADIRVDVTPNGPGEIQMLAIRRYREAVQCLGQWQSAILAMVVLENLSTSELARRLGVTQHYAALGAVIAVLNRLCEHYETPRRRNEKGAPSRAPLPSDQAVSA